MRGLLHGIGAGAAFSAAALIPFPVLALGGVLILASSAVQKEPEATPEAPEEPSLTADESAELQAFCELMDQAPDDRARAALIEEFYPDFDHV